MIILLFWIVWIFFIITVTPTDLVNRVSEGLEIKYETPQTLIETIDTVEIIYYLIVVVLTFFIIKLFTKKIEY